MLEWEQKLTVVERKRPPVDQLQKLILRRERIVLQAEILMAPVQRVRPVRLHLLVLRPEVIRQTQVLQGPEVIAQAALPGHLQDLTVRAVGLPVRQEVILPVEVLLQAEVTARVDLPHLQGVTAQVVQEVRQEATLQVQVAAAPEAAPQAVAAGHLRREETRKI